jgi:hypothetical protein
MDTQKNQETKSESKTIKAQHAAPRPDEQQNAGGENNDSGTEVNPGELGNNQEVDLDRSGPNEGGGEKEQNLSGYSGSAGSDSNRNAGGNVAGDDTSSGNVH